MVFFPPKVHLRPILSTPSCALNAQPFPIHTQAPIVSRASFPLLMSYFLGRKMKPSVSIPGCRTLNLMNR